MSVLIPPLSPPFRHFPSDRRDHHFHLDGCLFLFSDPFGPHLTHRSFFSPHRLPPGTRLVVYIMAAAGARAQKPVGSLAWIAAEKENIAELVDQEIEEVEYPARHEMEWLNEHMAEIFSKSQV